MGSGLIAKNWNKRETLSQNYRRLGLVAKLGHTAGGVEPEVETESKTKSLTAKTAPREKNPFAVKTTPQQVYSEARVERDPETGKILRVLDRGGRDNPLNDPLRQFDSDSSDEEQDSDNKHSDEWAGAGEEEEVEDSRVVRELERQANRPVEKPVRHQSELEIEWLQRLVGRHGDDVETMAKDLKLNPMQQTGADIKRRLRRWREGAKK